MVLCTLAYASNAWQLGGTLVLFGITRYLCNISVNTQGELTERLYQISIMTSVHSYWSIAGFTGAIIGLVSLNIDLSTQTHFYIIMGLMFINILLNRAYLVQDDSNPSEKKSFSFKPDRLLISLGVIGFCSMAT